MLSAMGIKCQIIKLWGWLILNTHLNDAYIFPWLNFRYWNTYLKFEEVISVLSHHCVCVWGGAWRGNKVKRMFTKVLWLSQWLSIAWLRVSDRHVAWLSVIKPVEPYFEMPFLKIVLKYPWFKALLFLVFFILLISLYKISYFSQNKSTKYHIHPRINPQNIIFFPE